MTTRYSLDQFVADMSALVDSQPEQEMLFDTGSSYLERLINNPEALPVRYRNPSASGRFKNHGSYLLHHGDNGLLVTAVVWGPGDHAPPHDHRTWGMIGVMGNAITETRFRRVDDRRQPEFAQLEQDRVVISKPGEISLLIPVVDEIHQMDNPSDRPTVEIHVYGKDLRGLRRSAFDLKTGRVADFTTKRFDNC